MKILRFAISLLSLFLLLPIDMMAGGELIFSDLNFNDGFTCTTPLQKENLSVSIQNGTGKYNKQMRAMVLPKGTTITISTTSGETISGLSLRPSGKSSDMRDFFSCETGKFEHGFWSGSANSVTFKCLIDCNVSKIRASFKTDAPEAYVAKVYNWEGRYLHVLYDGYSLLFNYNEQRKMYDETFSIDDDSEYPQWHNARSIISIKIDSSFANYRPKRTSHWFDGMESNISGLCNLNTSETADMSFMFANFNYLPQYYWDEYLECLRTNDSDIDDFTASIFGVLDFSNVRDMNHMFYRCKLSHYKIPSLHINSKTNTKGMFEESNIKYVKLSSLDIKLNDNFFDGAGSTINPCGIEAPDSYDFGTNTDVEQFHWKGGTFGGFVNQGYVAVENYLSVGSYGYANGKMSITFLFDDKKNIREHDGYEYYVLDDFEMERSLSIHTYGINDNNEEPSWLKNKYISKQDGFFASFFAGFDLDYLMSEEYISEYDLTKVLIDESFASFKPKSTYRWFDYGEPNVTCEYYCHGSTNFLIKRIDGLENLDMSESTNAARMFCQLVGLDSLDLSMLNMTKVVNTDSMFFGCSNLEYVMLPKNCTTIGVGAFYNCTDLGSITIPRSIKTIGNHAFDNCTKLTTVIIENPTPISITDNAFPYRKSQTLCVPVGSKRAYQSANYWKDFGNIVENGNIVFADAKVKAICIENWDTDGDGELSFSEAIAVRTLGANFINTQISSFDELKYFAGLNVIDGSFQNCTRLASITIPNSIEKINNNAFSGCTNLTSITFGIGVSSFGWNCFKGCTNLNKVNIIDIAKWCEIEFWGSDSNPLSIAHNLYLNNEKVTELMIPSEVTKIGDYAFNGCTSLNSVDIPSNVTTFGFCAFNGCINLNKLNISDITKWCDIQFENASCNPLNYAHNLFLNNEKVTNLTILNDVKEIGNYIFSGCTSLTSLDFPNSITSIGNYAFSNCTGLTSLNIPNSITSIGDNVFSGCTSLTSVVIPNSVTSIGNNTFSDCTSLISVIIPNSVSTIGNNTFANCSNLTSIFLDSSVPNFGKDCFSGCTNFNKVNITDIAKWCTIQFEDASRNPLYYAHNLYLNNEKVTELVIPNYVTSIGNYAFDGCYSLSSVILGANVGEIGSYAFANCSGLKTVTSLAVSPAKISASNTFPDRENQILYVPKGCKPAYEDASYWWTFKEIIELEDETITFADAIVKSLCINNWDTNGDGELSLNEAAAATSLGTVFKSSKITSFNELQYFTGLTSINEGAFSNSTIKEVTLPETVTSLAKDAFLYCKSLQSLHFPPSLASIGQNALSGCSALKDITVDEANEYFCDIDGVLFNKDKTTLVQFPIAKGTDYSVPEGTKAIGMDAFFMSKLVTVTLPASLEELGYDAFGYSTSLTEVNIPEGVTTFGPYVFDGCSALKDVYCDITAPYAIDKNNFSTKAYSNATLHVLPYLVDTYKNLEGWKYFANIKGDVIDYAVTAEATTVNLGETAQLPVLVANTGEIDGMQFDFTLPAGVTVATDMVGGLVVTTTDRSNKLTATCVKIADNTYRAILLSINRAIVAAGEGAVLNIQLQCADDAAVGEYDIAFTNVSVSRVEGDKSVNVRVADFTAPLTIVEISKIPGDVDGNFTVDVTDVMIIVDYILNRPCNNFNFANADLDGDGTINVTDAMNVVNIILHKSNVRVSPTAMLLDRGLLRLGTSETGCQLHTAFDSPQITALQMEVTLPEGCRLNNVSLTGKAARSHMVKAYQIYDRTYNVVVFSIKGSNLDTDAPFLQLDLEGNGGLVEIENILCTDTSHKSLTSPNLSAEVTGITAVVADDNSDTPVYNLSGQRIVKPRKGINITNGKKVVVK